MMTEYEVGGYTVRGRSLGGMYTGLHVPQLGAMLDVGTAMRSACAAPNLFLSHAHVDHIGALPAMLGMRGLTGVTKALRIFAPTAVAEGLPAALDAFSVMHRWAFDVELVPMAPGDVFQLRRDLWVRAIKTHHPVPSLGYVFFRRVKKLRPEFLALPGPEIGRRRRAGEGLFDETEILDLGFATDTLPRVFETAPELLKVKTLVVECTFLDDRKSLEAARAGCHIHLDELLPLLPHIQAQHIVLMHFSQLYNPADVHRILTERLSPADRARVVALAPQTGTWWD